MSAIASLLSRLQEGDELDADLLAELRALALAGRLVVREPTKEALRRQKIPARDAAIREFVREHMTALPRSIAAQRLAALLAAPGSAPPAQRNHLAHLLELSGCQLLGWRQIHRILKSAAASNCHASNGDDNGGELAKSHEKQARRA